MSSSKRATDADLAPLQALLLPFETGAIAWPPDHPVLFLRARDGWPLRTLPAARIEVEQPYKPHADALARAGYPAAGASGEAAPLVLLLPPRQRDEMRALFAQALDRCASGGIVVASIANDAGAKSGEADLRRLAGLDGCLSKHHCRVFWVRKDPAKLGHALLDAWRMLDAPRFVQDPRLPQGGFLTRPGVFAWDRIDPASALLASHLPHDPGSGPGQALAGRGADLGAGWGYLAIEALRRSANIEAFDLYEADARALDLARTNLAATGSSAAVSFHWHDVTTGLPGVGYDFIVSNPPFHAQGRADRPELGQRFIEIAAQALRPGGRLYLVANRHLPYEAALAAQFGRVRVLAQQHGFKAIEAVRSGSGKAAR